ncbi:WD40 repeat domain-containing protein [Mariniflexile sp. AS56]|uniref:WD40 repeat domain-containing protein n=1 Tax=Mariniflexile sp. AS56 TaxID=3063957 RepID=UPI0026E92F4E|nr:WD40 repeat domain-containing protein [Mariniflexile sp. AS56]MDO7173864.1 WD40 repeat domain-containing protein [Mariniflexile sp. AS56]
MIANNEDPQFECIRELLKMVYEIVTPKARNTDQARAMEIVFKVERLGFEVCGWKTINRARKRYLLNDENKPNPYPITLDTLARYMEYEDFKDYNQKYWQGKESKHKTSIETEIISLSPEHSEKVYSRYIAFIVDALSKESSARLDKIQQLADSKIEPEILPFIESIGQGYQDISSYLEKLWKENPVNPNLFLVAEGGGGKTFSLYKIWQDYINGPQSVVPVYLTLKDVLIDESSRLSVEIANFALSHLALTEDEGERANSINKIFSKAPDKSGYRFLILLDALNEVADPKFIDNFLRGTKLWRSVQIIITSKNQYYNEVLEYYNYSNLSSLDINTIEKFLETKNVAFNKSMLKLLSNPFRLTMFAKTTGVIEQQKRTLSDRLESKTVRLIKENTSYTFKKDDKYFYLEDEFYSGGELIFNYIQSISIKEILKVKEDEFSNEIIAKFKFAIEELLPAIAYRCYAEVKFSIDLQEIVELVNAVIAPDITKKYITETVDLCEEKLTLLKRNPINSYYEFYHQEIRDFFVACNILSQLNFWCYGQKSKKWKSQHLPITIKETILPKTILRYMGEIDSQHRNVAVIENNSWTYGHYRKYIIAETLENLRGIFDTKLLGNAPKNMVNTLLTVKNDLSGDNLNNLNLKGIDFSNVIFSRRDENYVKEFYSCSFEDSKIDLSSFFPRGHRPARINSYIYLDSYDNKILRLEAKDGILTSGTKSELIKWNIDDGSYIEKLSVPYLFDEALHSILGGNIQNKEIANCPIDVYFNTHEAITVTRSNVNKTLFKYFIKANENLLHHGYSNYDDNNFGLLCVWDLTTADRNRIYYIFEGGWYDHSKKLQILAITNPDGKSLSIFDDQRRKKSWDEIAKVNGNTRGIWYLIEDVGLLSKIEYSGLIKCVAINPNENSPTLITASYDNKIIEWNYLTGEKVRNFENIHADKDFVLGYTNDSKYLVTSNCEMDYVSEFSTVHEIENLSNYKGISYGNLRFWSMEDKKLSRELVTNDDELIRKVIFLNKELEETDHDIKYFVTGGQHGSIKLWDYETLENVYTFSLASKKLIPNVIKARPFDNTFMVAYDGGLLKLFTLGAHSCKAVSKGSIQHPSYIEFFGPKLVIVSDIRNGECEVWDLNLFRRRGTKFSIIENSEFSCFKITPCLDRLYVCVRNPQSHVSKFTLKIFDIDSNKNIKNYDINETIDTQNIYLSSNNKYFISWNKSKKSIIIYDLDGNKSIRELPFEGINGLHFLNELEYLNKDYKLLHFLIRLKQGDFYMIDFDEDSVNFTCMKGEGLPQFDKIERFITTNNEPRYGLINTIYGDDHKSPTIREVYEWNGQRSINKIETFKDAWVQEKYFQYWLNTEKSFDYSFYNDCQISLMKNREDEIWTFEMCPKDKRIQRSTYHEDEIILAVQGCKFPSVKTHFDSYLQEIAMNLEENLAEFPPIYHFYNYPDTYQHRKMFQQSTKIPFKLIFVLAYKLRKFQRKIKFATNSSKKSGIKQNPDTPYPFKLGGTENKYYPPVKYL